VYFGKAPENPPTVDVMVNAKSDAGLYVDLNVNGVKINHFGYLKILKIGKDKIGLVQCLEVESNATQLYPGSVVQFNVTNKCQVPFTLSIKADIVNMADIELKKVYMDANKTVSITVKVPKLYGVELPGLFGPGPTVYVRGVYLEVEGTELYYVPSYDFFVYFIKPNLKATYYVNGREVSAAKAGELVKGCVSVPNVVPVEKVPRMNAYLKAVEDLAFAPDKVVTKREVTIEKLPFEKCIGFLVKKSWNTRGYKLQLDVKEEVEALGKKIPLVTSAEAKPELKVK
jgi:hypothetical protein